MILTHATRQVVRRECGARRVAGWEGMMEAQVREWVPWRVSAGTVKHVTKSMRGLPPGLDLPRFHGRLVLGVDGV